MSLFSIIIKMLKSSSLSAALKEKNDNLDLKNKLSQVT